MALTLTAVSPAEVHQLGGVRLELTGTFVQYRAHRVYLGLTATTEDLECHSGQVGVAGVCSSDDGLTLVTFTPQLPIPGVALHVLVEDTVTGDLAVLPSAVTVRRKDYSLLTFSLRSLLSQFWKTGPRSMDRLPPL